MKARISGFAPEIEKALIAETEKHCEAIISANSKDMMRRCLNLLLVSCANVGLSEKTARRIKRDLEENVLPAWDEYVSTGDGDAAIRYHLTRIGFPFYAPDTQM